MNKKPSQQLLEKNPALEMFIEQGRFLTGYIVEAKQGSQFPYFFATPLGQTIAFKPLLVNVLLLEKLLSSAMDIKKVSVY